VISQLPNIGILDFAGILGAIIIIIAYSNISIGSWNKSSVLYHVANAIGATLILFSLIPSFNWATLILQIVWILIAIMGLLKLRR